MADWIIAERYAKALIELADADEVDRLDREIATLIKSMETDEIFSRFLVCPTIVPEQKKKLVKQIFGDKLSHNLINLIFLLIDKHREGIISEVFETFRNLAENLRGVEVGTVVTAVPIDDEDFALLQNSIQKFSKRNISLHKEVDKSIIGGIVIKLGDTIIDGSVRYRLQQIRRHLLNSKTRLDEINLSNMN